VQLKSISQINYEIPKTINNLFIYPNLSRYSPYKSGADHCGDYLADHHALTCTIQHGRGYSSTRVMRTPKIRI
jgi:hypothetical protein